MQEVRTNPPYALITGGSEGIGQSIADALAGQGYNLLLVALPDDKLEASAKALADLHGCVVHHLGVDLTLQNADRQVFEWVKSLGCNVSVLVNNAGYGSLGKFSTFDRDFYHNMMMINVVNVVGLTRLMLDDLQRMPESHILNVGSIASFFPMPYKTVYASTKYFIYSFSRALREELRSSTVKVSLMCPGPVNTNEKVKERIRMAGYIGRATALNPGYVGRLVTRQMLRGKWLILPGFPAKAGYYFEKILPLRLKQRLIARQFNCRNGEI
ncbi:MAG: SDR family NAD(P)-dependent oxidoreductase [Bacteroidales bacterium]